MTLLSPGWLLLLVPVALLALAYLVQQRRRSRYAVRFASLPMLERLVPHRPGWRRHAPATALLFTFALLGLAAARPEMEVRVPRENATVIVAVDVSTSMKATDVEPNRLDAAAAAATRFVEDLPEGFNAGVVTFSGRTAVRAAPTAERETVLAALQGLTLAGRTAIGEGVFTSLEQVEAMATRAEESDVPAHVVLLSDGTNTTGRTPEEAAEAAREAGVPVSTIAYGTPAGTIENQGRMVAVPVDEETLASLAEGSGGRAYTAQSSDELNEVYDNIQSSIGWRMEPREVTQYAAAGALALGLLAAALSLRWFSRLP
jgi:Ca-activated chloride channel family protein